MATQEFGARLRELRKQAGLSQRELADKVGINFTYLSKIESGVMPPPSQRVILRLAEVLSTDKDELMVLAGRIPADIAQLLKNRRAWQLLRSGRIQRKLRITNKKEGVSVVKNLTNFKRLPRMAIATTLVCAVAASLWFASPTKALTISYPSSPSSGSTWPSGTYKVKAIVYGNGSKIFTGTSTSFSLSAAAAVVGGGGAPAPKKPKVTPGVTDVSDFITSRGYFTDNVTAESEDGLVNLNISKGTIGKTKEDKALSEISILEMEEPPDPPADYSIIGLTYNLGPDGATFTPAVTLTFTYNNNDMPEGVNEADLVLAIWDEEAGEWIELASIVDPVNNTITVQISHLTPYTILSRTRPAAFTTADLSVSPSEVDVGEGVTIRALVTNTGDLAGSYKVTLKLNGKLVATEEVTLAGGDSKTVTFVTTQDVAGTCTVNVNGLSGTFTVRQPVVPAPAAFTTSGLTVSPAEVDIGQRVTIRALATNTGDLAGSYKVTLKLNGKLVATEEVTLAGGDSKTVTFVTTQDTAGTYTVNINGLSGTFTVKQPVVPPQPTKINWWLIGGIIAFVIVIGVSIWLILRRRANNRANNTISL